MRAIQSLKPDEGKEIRYVLCDIDDTLTENGLLLSEAFDALWRLKRADFCVIPVTGRPAGWCDMIIRQWPVEAVIGENGAFAMLRTSTGFETILHSSVAPDAVKQNLKRIEKRVLRDFPGMKVAKDQPFRWFDLALDFAEDPPIFGMDTAVRIKQVCEEFGAVAKISSIHVNTWFGNYSKLEMALQLLHTRFQLEEDELKRQVFFCGDSPNDEPMFGFFPLSCGVANIAPFTDMLTSKPGFIAGKIGGKGFAEAAEILLQIGKNEHPDLT